MLETVAENASFIAVCVIVFAALCVTAILSERLISGKKTRFGAKEIAYIAMFSAIGGVLMVIDFPLFFAPSFYKIDLSELPALICGFSLGPTAGVVCELIKVLIKLLLKGTTTAFVGDFSNFVIGCSMVLPAAIVYRKLHTKRGAVVSLAVGSLIMTVFGSMFNALYLIPKFAELYGMPLDAIVSMGTAVNGSISSVATLVLFAVVPFNLVKAVIVSVLTMLLYKRVRSIMKL